MRWGVNDRLLWSVITTVVGDSIDDGANQPCRLAEMHAGTG